MYPVQATKHPLTHSDTHTHRHIDTQRHTHTSTNSFVHLWLTDVAIHISYDLSTPLEEVSVHSVIARNDAAGGHAQVDAEVEASSRHWEFILDRERRGELAAAA